ncbi:hypothetical protein XENTR_v10006241 [Xenopus tropicalis]|nr:hypothetical protein XENTR_v10006241 [Xenopus tropicalis]
MYQFKAYTCRILNFNLYSFAPTKCIITKLLSLWQVLSVHKSACIGLYLKTKHSTFGIPAFISNDISRKAIILQTFLLCSLIKVMHGHILHINVNKLCSFL